MVSMTGQQDIAECMSCGRALTAADMTGSLSCLLYGMHHEYRHRSARVLIVSRADYAHPTRNASADGHAWR